MNLNKVAWEILTPDEKTALTLQYGLQKSSWQSGEIMNKSHYKYLEIKYRAEQFLKMFTEHVELFDRLIPDDINCNKTVLAFFRLCLEKRNKPLEALKELNKDKPITKAQLNEKIIAQFKDWAKSESAYDNTVFNLIKEFDRWNNFRILPKSIQEPSAFKRRIKNVYKKQVRTTANLNTISLDKLLKTYKAKSSPYLWLPIIYNKEPQIHKVKVNSASLKIFSGIGLYLFKNKENGEEYIAALHDYTAKGKKACTDGLEFWPKYRELIKKSENYQEVQNISSSRRYLQMALSKLEFL